MRKVIFTLLLGVSLVVTLIIPAYADIGFTQGSVSSYVYSDNYNITVNTENNVTFDDNGGGKQIFPSLRFGSQNSVVNALYQGAALQLRKATQNVSTNVSTNSFGRATFYTSYTNLTDVSGYSIKLTIPQFTVGIPETLDDLYLYLSVNGSIQEIYYEFEMQQVEYENGIAYITTSDPVYGALDEYVGTTGGNLMTAGLLSDISTLVPEQYENANANGDWYLYNLFIELYVVPPTTDRTVAYTVGQTYRPYPPYPTEFEVIAPEPVVVDDDLVDWLGRCVGSVFDTPIFPVANGYLTIGTVVWAVLGVALVLMFIKFFAGG